MNDTPQKWDIFTGADPTVTRIIPELAKEIGLNESIILMQIAFWIKNSNNLYDGVYWTYQSLRDMRKKAFPYWAATTIQRAIQNLADAKYIIVGNHNKRKGDNTQWFALNPDTLSSLKSVLVMPILPVENETTLPETTTKKKSGSSAKVFQSETGVFQDETTLPETTTRDKEKDIAPNGAGGQSKQPKPRNVLFDIIAEKSFGLTGDIKQPAGGRVARILKYCKGEDVTPDELTAFYVWYAATVKAACPRDVGKFAEHFTAFRAARVKKQAAPQVVIAPEPVEEVVTPEQLAARRALTQSVRPEWEMRHE